MEALKTLMAAVVVRFKCYFMRSLAGSCMQVFAQVNRYFLYSRDTGYRGYSCLDDREAESDFNQMTEMLLLTVTNLAFLPAAVVAFYKRCHCAAVVYIFTGFFSTVSSAY